MTLEPSAGATAGIAPDMPAIQLINIGKSYGGFRALQGVSMTVERGSRMVVCGPSGSGKSTLIRCINRLEIHDAGAIIVNGVELTDQLVRIDHVRREVGMVFQHFNLFPHLTALQNCTLAQRWVRKRSQREAADIAMAYLERVRIPEKANSFPSELSGGQQQSPSLEPCA